MDTSVEDLAKAVRDPLRSQCPKFGDDTSKSNTIILTEKVDKNNSALNVFLVYVFVQFARQELNTLLLNLLVFQGQDHILACAIFLLESKSVMSEANDEPTETNLKSDMVQYFIRVAR